MKLYWDNLEIGYKLLLQETMPITRVQIAQFLGITKDFSPLYVDDDYAKSVGFSQSFVPNLLPLCLLEDAFLDCNQNVNPISICATFHRITRPNDRLTGQGLLLQHYEKNGEYLACFELWYQNQNLDVVMKASALCLLFKNIEDERAAKTPRPLVKRERHKELLELWQKAEGEKEDLNMKASKVLETDPV